MLLEGWDLRVLAILSWPFQVAGQSELASPSAHHAALVMCGNETFDETLVKLHYIPVL